MTGTDRTIGQAVAKLRERLGDRLSIGASVRELHARDEAYSAPALPDAVAFPDNAEEVAAIARICAGTGCPIGASAGRGECRFQPHEPDSRD